MWLALATVLSTLGGGAADLAPLLKPQLARPMMFLSSVKIVPAVGSDDGEDGQPTRRRTLGPQATAEARRRRGNPSDADSGRLRFGLAQAPAAR